LALIAISLGASTACWWAAGNSLGLFFGGLFVVTFLIPAGVLGWGKFREVIAGLASVIGPILIVWLIPALKGVDTLGQWLLTALVLAAYAVAVGGIARILTRMKFPPVFAAGAAVIISLAWLTWPVWLSTMLVQSGRSGIVQNLVVVHPPLVINGILTNEPAWTERSLAYHLTDLNQDVPIRLPANPAPCVALHGIAGLALWSAALFRRRRLEDVRRFENGVKPA